MTITRPVPSFAPQPGQAGGQPAPGGNAGTPPSGALPATMGSVEAGRQQPVTSGAGQPRQVAPGVTIQQATPPRQAFNEGQGRAATYADRMVQANRVLDELPTAGMDRVDRLAAGVPVVGNALVSEPYQRVDQAQRDFINAVLRRESGAVISDAEFANARLQYFPQPGDSPATLAQKRRNRETTIAGISREAGPSYQPPQSARQNAVAPPLAERQAGQTYDTPRGPMVWSGTGWRMPQ